MTRRRPDDGPRRDVGLALRADRRRRGQSQRAYAEARAISRQILVRAEVDAGNLRLDVVLSLLRGTGYDLSVAPVEAAAHPVEWERTDLLATTRSGSRFPANRTVRESPAGPLWWLYHEMLGSRGFGPQPGWTAEGFIPPEGARYGRTPRPYAEGEGPRWPY